MTCNEKEKWFESDVSETQLNRVTPTMVVDKYISILGKTLIFYSWRKFS